LQEAASSEGIVLQKAMLFLTGWLETRQNKTRNNIMVESHLAGPASLCHFIILSFYMMIII
jgi:hypothetical protein